MRSFALLLVLMFGLPCIGTAQKLLPFQNKDGLWGYKNVKGEVVISPVYYQASEYAEGYALVSVKDDFSIRWGVLDSRGQVALPLEYDYVDLCSEGYVAVYEGPVSETGIMTDGSWGLVKLDNPDVKVLSGMGLIGPVKGGLFWVSLTNVKREMRIMPIVDKKGKQIGKEYIFGVSDHFKMADLFPVGSDSTYYGSWVLVDTAMCAVTDQEAPYKMVGEFSGDLAWVMRGSSYGYIDRFGEEVIPTRYVMVEGAPEALPVSIRLRPSRGTVRWVMNHNGEIGWLDQNGDVVVDFMESDGKVSVNDVVKEQLWDF